MRTEDDLRHALSDAAHRAASGSPEARARVGKLVRRQRAWRVGAVAGVAIALAAFGIVTITRPDHHASLRVVSPGPSPSPTAVPGPEPDTASSVPGATASGTVPAGFSAVSITFVSAKDGFVLGSAPCATGQCTVVLRTTDTGTTWHRIGAPPAAVTTKNGPGAVRAIRFATVDDGWAYGPDLWATHDGGLHWTKTHADGEVMDLEASAGVAHSVVLTSGDSRVEYELLSTPVSREEWAVSPTTVPKGAAPVADAQIVLQGRSGWMVVDDRTVYAGARLTPSGWVNWKPPCEDAFGRAILLAPTASNVVAVCREGDWGGQLPPGTGLYESTDSGDSFRRVASVPPHPSSAASPSPNTVVVSGAASGGEIGLFGSFDRGATWSKVYSGTVLDLGFTTPTQGIGLEPDGPNGAERFVLSTDGGHRWHATAFGPRASATRRCATSDLALDLTNLPDDPGRTNVLTFALTNTSASPCAVSGYPGVSLLSSDGAPTPFHYSRGKNAQLTTRPPQHLDLGSGDSAWFSINRDACASSSGGAGAVLKVIPPDERSALALALPPRASMRLVPCFAGETVYMSPLAATPEATLAP